MKITWYAFVTASICSASADNACETKSLVCTGAEIPLGCVKDGAKDRLWAGDDQIHVSDDMTREKCFAFCKGQGYNFAGVECGSQCFCGPTPPPSSRQTNTPAWCAQGAVVPPCNATGPSCHHAHDVPQCCPGQPLEQSDRGTCGGFGIMEAFDITAVTCEVSPHRIDADYCNEALPIARRIADLTERATTAEKISMLGRHNHGIKRLAVPAFEFGEVLHGVNVKECLDNGSCSTSFPCALGTSASFNVSLFHAIGSTIGKESRALFNVGLSHAAVADWSPDINLFRHPVWGRGQEVPSEDPFLSSAYAREYILGLQGGSKPTDNATGLQTVATAKHLVAYDLERSTFGGETFLRHNFSANVSLQDLVSFYAVPFKVAVQDAKVHSIMCSYNAVQIDGGESIPACAHPFVENQLARDNWGFEGLMVSDCQAIADEGPGPLPVSKQAFGGHHWCETKAKDPSDIDDVMQHCVAESIKSGTDLDCPGNYYFEYAGPALDSGYLTEADVDRAFGRVVHTMFRLGIFDSADNQPYGRLGEADVDTAEARSLALEAAHQAVVLLKNEPVDGQVQLPLDPSQSLAVIGPHANCTQDFLSNYHGVNTLVDSNSPIAALSRFLGAAGQAKLEYAPGLSSIEDNDADSSLFRQAVAAAARADVAVVFAGIHQAQESENHDRLDLILPGAQHALIKAVYEANPRTVLVLINGGPIAIEWEARHLPAILETFYGGEMGGPAIVDVLYGIYNPSGRMPVTVYPSDYIKRSPFNMDLRADGGSTYMYYDGTTYGQVLYHFGHGLSYTSFEYERVSGDTPELTTDALAGGGMKYTVKVKNTGNVTGSTSVLGFVSANQPESPIRQLFAFEKVLLAPGQSALVHLNLSPGTPGAGIVGVDGLVRILSGEYTVDIEGLTWHHQVTGADVIVSETGLQSEPRTDLVHALVI